MRAPPETRNISAGSRGSRLAVGLTITGDLRTGTASLRRGEPWFPSAFQALEAVAVGNATDEHSKAIAPFS
ncbi:hypothetical protein [Streptomyces sp. NPDC056938]|uniref:hypothetical protein n=1 Tax=unclassified Streptomyces TaxID=2593676 RepID=UPI0036394630